MGCGSTLDGDVEVAAFTTVSATVTLADNPDAPAIRDARWHTNRGLGTHLGLLPPHVWHRDRRFCPAAPATPCRSSKKTMVPARRLDRSCTLAVRARCFGVSEPHTPRQVRQRAWRVTVSGRWLPANGFLEPDGDRLVEVLARVRAVLPDADVVFTHRLPCRIVTVTPDRDRSAFRTPRNLAKLGDARRSPGLISG